MPHVRSLPLRVSLAFGLCVCSSLALAQAKEQKPEAPVEKWTGKTIMLIGAHADDDMSSHGTLAMLQAHGNQVYVVTLTTGNVGTQDPNLSRTQLAQIRRQEELAALAGCGKSRFGSKLGVFLLTQNHHPRPISRSWGNCVRFGFRTFLPKRLFPQPVRLGNAKP